MFTQIIKEYLKPVMDFVIIHISQILVIFKDE